MLGVLILIVSVAAPCLSQTISPGPNVCSRVATRYKQVSYSTTVTLYRKGYRRCGTSTCTDNKSYTGTRQVYKQERELYTEYVCCKGYAYSNSTNNCQPVCDPPCVKGNCTTPGECSCDPKYTGDICQYAMCSSVKVTKVCYPGACAIVNNNHTCECSANFTGPLCLKLNPTTQQPSVAKCSVSFRLDGTANLWVLPKPCEAGQVYINVTTLASIKLDQTAAYSPKLAALPSYVTFRVGITRVEATFLHTFGTANGNESRTMNVVGFPPTFPDTQVFNLTTTFQLSHNSSFRFALKSSNGGFRYYKTGATNQSYSGTSREHDIKVTVDHVKPRHCSEPPGTCNMRAILITRNATYAARDRHVLSFPGWSDDVSGIATFTYSVLSDGFLVVGGRWDPSLPEPYFSKRPDAAFEIQLVVTDHAGNVAIERASLPARTVKKSNKTATIAGSVVAALVVAAAVFAVVCFLRRRSQGRRTHRSELRVNQRNALGTATYNANEHHDSDLYDHDTDCDIAHSLLSEFTPLDTGGVQPKFADFWQAKLVRQSMATQVVIKQLKAHLEGEEGMMREKVAFWRKLPSHSNILKFIGAVRMPNGPAAPAIVLELCTLGNLQVWLRQLKHKYDNKQFTLDDQDALINISDGVAKGLFHLHENKTIHGKLTCRNVLLTVSPPYPEVVPKITGFGPEKTQMAGDRPMRPLRWMSPDFLETDEATFKTDVWNYGTFLVELWSLGGKPWPHLQTSDEAKEAILRRDPVAKPDLMEDQMNTNIMQICFLEPDQRPDMSDITSRFETLYSDVKPPDEDYAPCGAVSRDPEYY